jgi:hypothetical protein
MTELTPEARRVLQLARAARTPSALDKRRIERRLAIGAGLSAAAASGAAVAHAAETASAAASGGMLASLKVYVAGGALLLSAAGGGYALLSQPTAAPARPQPTAAAPQVAAKRAVPAPAPARAVTPAPAPVEPISSPSRATRRPDTLARELDLLHDAQRAWRARDSERTLALLDQHAKRYPRSELRLERSALRVLALCEVGRERDARKLARTLIRLAPNSPVRATIEESCAIP